MAALRGFGFTGGRDDHVRRMRLHDLNALDDAAAARELLRCCGSTRWAERMMAARPFPTEAALEDAADRIWWSLEAADWREAFAAHPKIGARPREGGAMAGTELWAAQEQAGVTRGSGDVARRLAIANHDYEARFGYIFIVCATGKSAAEMLEALEHRLGNPPEQELRIAAGEQRKITRLRLAKLLDADGTRISST
jgi:2-oxo-4-hydroxy-4-carboxy-5-ureidoimidazoline decarboxylase